MGRLIAIDYGLKRCGLAVTDPLQLIANPWEMVPENKLLDFLKHYLATEPVDGIVVGMPKRLDNTDTHATGPVRKLILKLQKEFPGVAVYEEDERFTSSLALDAMIRSGSKKKDRRQKGNIDKVSAAIILQSFLERQKR